MICRFVHGGVQTGSGKTFTTFGPGAVMENHLNPSDPKSYALRGLVPRVLEYLYANIARQVDNGGGKVRLNGIGWLGEDAVDGG